MVVDFPTLGDLIDAWAERHCLVPDGFMRGNPFRMSDWQFWCVANHYRVRADAVFVDPVDATDDNPVLLNQAFVYRRSQVIAPQKALALDTPIPTPSGWTTMGDVRVGEFVFDEAGNPTRVVSKSQIWHSDTYRVRFSDGEELVACKDHQWWVERRTPSGTYVEDRVRTEDLVGNLTDKHGARRFRVPVAGALALPEVDLPVAPYTLGAWLGDGESSGGRITGIDREVFERIAADGFEVRPTKIAKRTQVVGLVGKLRGAGVLNNKHIPEEYLRASARQRWELLRGLMDTDGYCDERQGKCEYTTTSEALMRGVVELLLSLGLRPVVHQGEASLYGRVTGPKWRIAFAARSDVEIFGLERKQSRLREPGRGHAQYKHRRIVAVERVETVPTQCLTVEAESHVFLAGRGMIPTCNTGKGPWAAVVTAVEAAGPSLFAGWASDGDVYSCAENGCPCGWVYGYEPGEPMGMRHPSPLIQLTATAEDQVMNVYRPLSAMVRRGPLSKLMKVNEGFIRITGLSGEDDADRIDIVTASARARLGNPISFAVQDETGLYTKSNKLVEVADAQRRGAAGMGGRTIETSNAYDPTENSQAQRTFESSADDVFRFYREPPAQLSYRNKRERRKIHEYVYAGSPWVNLDSIEAEAAEIMETDPAQAERFFGNRRVQGSGTFISPELWRDSHGVPEGARIALGFDGSTSGDWSAIRAETADGVVFTPTYGPDDRPTWWNPQEWGGRIPRSEVHAAVDELFSRYQVKRMYCDPRDWRTEIDDWANTYGDEVVVEWPTFSISRMHNSLNRFITDLEQGRIKHDDDKQAEIHALNARMLAKPGDKFILGKPSEHQKIDILMASVLAHEAAADSRAEGWLTADRRVLVFR